MPLMRVLGIRRAKVDVRGLWRHGALTQATVYRRLFYRCYSCSLGEVTDVQQLIHIERSPLRAALDAAALALARRATPPTVMDHPPKIEGKRVEVWETFLDAPGAPGSRLLGQLPNEVWPVPGEGILAQAVWAIENDDPRTLICAVGSGQLTARDMQSLLVEAAAFFYSDRASEIEILAAWGANPNMPDRYGDLPLTRAGNPLAVAALLGMGANPSARNENGVSAIEVALWQAQHYSGPTTQCVLALLRAAMRPVGSDDKH